MRDARPAELAEIGALRVAAYEAGGFLSDASHYGETLRTLGHDGIGQILVAVGERGRRPWDARLLGTVMLQLLAARRARGPGAGRGRGSGAGRGPGGPRARRGPGAAAAVTSRARAGGVQRLLLSTQTTMLAAQHLYTEAGFRRLPDRDWDPVPGFTLLAYGLDLADYRRCGPAHAG